MRVPQSAPLGRRPRLLLTVLVVVPVMLATTLGLLWHRQHRADLTDRARVDALATARSQVVDMLSYDYRSVRRELARAGAGLTGAFRHDYTELGRSRIVPAATRQQITTRAQVVGSGVVDAEPDRVVALLFVNRTTVNSTRSEPEIDNSQLRMTLVRIDGRWLVSRLVPL